jgi:hypothetical protein
MCECRRAELEIQALGLSSKITALEQTRKLFIAQNCFVFDHQPGARIDVNDVEGNKTRFEYRVRESPLRQQLEAEWVSLEAQLNEATNESDEIRATLARQIEAVLHGEAVHV